MPGPKKAHGLKGMTVNPLLTPYLNFTHPENAPKLNQRSSFTPTPYPSRKGQLYHIYIYYYIYIHIIYIIYILLLNIPSDKSYTVSTNREGENASKLGFPTIKWHFPLCHTLVKKLQ